MQVAYGGDPAADALSKKRRRVDSNRSNQSGVSATGQLCVPTTPLHFDQADYSQSSLRQVNQFSASVDELWPLLWLHPDINAVVGRMTRKIEDGDYTYRRNWELMQIGDLQIVYQLSGMPQALRGEGKAQNCLLIASAALRCALALSTPQVKHQIAPDCFMEREIQLRALVSMLSLLQLLKSQTPGRGPVLTAATATKLWDNLRVLQDDLSKGLGSAADKGDCEFMARYAQNLLADLPGDDSTATKWTSSIMNIFFAAGMAYQYNGPEAIKHLKQAIEPLNRRGTSWHAEFDRLHHVTMVIISWSLYQNAGSSPQFRQACCDMIAILRNKLRDGINNLNAQGSTKRKISALFPSTEATDTSVHMTYGLLYLIGRLVERYMTGGGSSQSAQIRELTRLLVWACQKSKFGEIKFKAYEILFSILAPIPAANTADTLMIHLRMTEMEGESRIEREKRHDEWAAHVECILERKWLIDNSLAKLDLQQIRRAKDDYEQQQAQRGAPLTPPTFCPEVEPSPDSIYNGSSGASAVVPPNRRLDILPHPFLTPNLPPLSPTASSASSEEYVWQQSPRPFSLDSVTRSEPAKIKLNGTPVCTQVSGSGRSVAFLSRDHLDVYTVALDERPDGAVDMALMQKLDVDLLPKKCEFVAAALNDRFVVAISRNQLQLYDFSSTTVALSSIDFAYHPEPVLHLTSVAVSSSTTRPLVALGVVLPDKHARIHLYEVPSDRGHLVAYPIRTLEFGSAVPQPHGAPHALSFSSDGTHLVSGSTRRGALLTWNLSSESPTPSYRTDVPVNDGLGHGIAGVTSAALFPSTRFILATTGASSQPAVIKARSASNRRPGTLNILAPRAAMRSGAVAALENAFALLTEGGKVFVSRLQGLGLQPGYSASPPTEVLDFKKVIRGNLGFGMLAGSERQVLVAAVITSPALKKRYRGEVVVVAF